MSTEREMRSDSGLALRSDLHLLRKLWHICIGALGLLFFISSNIPAREMANFLLIFSLIMFAIEFSRLKVKSLNKIALNIMGPFMRESERTSLSGLPFYAMGVGLSLFFFEERMALLSICFLVFADPISSFFGILYGRDKLYKNKSVQGSLAGLITCYLLTMIFGVILIGPILPLFIFALIAGFIGAFSELCSVYIDDNLTIPVISGAGLSLLNLLIPVF